MLQQIDDAIDRGVPLTCIDISDPSIYMLDFGVFADALLKSAQYRFVAFAAMPSALAKSALGHRSVTGAGNDAPP